MKGPSLDAIRKFKQEQEEKKKLEYDRKEREKLTTLEHRAAQGDRKAKTQLKQIEKVQEDRGRSKDLQKNHTSRASSSAADQRSADDRSTKQNGKTFSNRPKQSGLDFDELMKLASSNTNEVKHEERRKPIPKQRRPIDRIQSSVQHTSRERLASSTVQEGKELVASKSITKQPVKVVGPSKAPQPSVSHIERRPMMKYQAPGHARPRVPARRDYYGDDYDDEDDEYESDGFIVDEDDDEVKDELNKTLRTVFRYDKRRCDLREQELDRQYRAIGRVNTFEDLEREERRASRLAAAEDAEAQRDLEERKRLKRQRLRDMRDD